jgi:DNA-binding Xre family transcriptional regulator
MPVKVTLKEYLTQRNLSTYKLVQATTGRIAERTVYALARPGVKRMDLEALHDLTGETVTPNDLLEVIEEPVSLTRIDNHSHCFWIISDDQS